ncbi:4Fe-4S cluster-binding domain-containing protein [bacterium]|nr:MAG: 4Fe-4S cluster-binding domain-containing protein [bacterium]
MKYTLSVTNSCNLSCKYCYIGKKNDVMGLNIVEEIIKFIFKYTPKTERIEIGFFGGEPLLELGLIKGIASRVESHPSFDPDRVEFTLTTNGTLLNEEAARFINKRSIAYCVSCDGPPEVHNANRRFKNGRASSPLIERNLKRALDLFPSVLVNAVYTPTTLSKLPSVVDYFSSLGLKQMYLSPDFSADWSKDDIALLPEVYNNVADRYIEFYRVGRPHFINLIDLKITAMLRGGYQATERCSMGRGEFAFAPSGNIYPCERLIGNDDGVTHCIGNILTGLNASGMACKTAEGGEVNARCAVCAIKEYCMNWCGCSNYFSSGFYNRVSPFLCASERAAITAAHRAFQIIENESKVTFNEHLSGMPAANCMKG